MFFSSFAEIVLKNFYNFLISSLLIDFFVEIILQLCNFSFFGDYFFVEAILDL